MPKLLQINVTANWGSTGKIAEQIGLCAQARSWESYIAYGRMMNPSKSHLMKVGNKLDNYIHYAENRLLDNEGLSSRNATKKLIKEIEKLHPDVIQLHNIHDHFLNYRLLFEYLNKTEIQVVWTFHDCWAFTGHCYHFVGSDCMRWKDGCHDCPQRDKFSDRSERNWNLKKSLFASYPNLAIVPVSHWMGGFVKESFLKDKRIEVIHNGIDLKVFSPKPSTGSGKFNILAVSNVWPSYKGGADICKLREMLPVEDYDITMVGLSEEQVKSLPAGIKGIQRTQNVQELVELYSAADVLINPTYADSFPTVNLEALACGTPVITYMTGGSPEAVDENTGAVIEQGDIEGFCAKIQEFKATGFKQQHSVECRKRAEECFDKDKCFEKYIHLYEQLILQ